MIKFDYKYTERMKIELQNMNSRYCKELESLIECEQMLCGMWEGPAQQVFHQNFLRDMEQMKNFAKLIDAYILALDIIATNYRLADCYGQEAIGKLLRHDVEYALALIKQAWNVMQNSFSNILEGHEMKPLSDMEQLKKMLGLPETFDWSEEDFLKELTEDKKNFINKWAKLLNGSITFTDGDFAPKLLEIAGYMFRQTPLCYLAYKLTDDSKVVNKLFDILDFDCPDNDGIYHVNVHNWGDGDDLVLLQKIAQMIGCDDGFCFQQFGGYTDLYDTVFDVFCDMDANNDLIFTTAAGEVYTLWFWKGEYMNLGSGGECGLYKGNARQKGTFGQNYVKCATDHEVPMKMAVDYGNGNVTNYADESTWWITSFNSNEREISSNDISITYTLDFSDEPDMLEGFIKTAKEYKGEELEIDCSKEPYITIKYLNENEKNSKI